MKIIYRTTDSGAEILRCYDYGSEAEIPGSLDGIPVVSLAPYAFSSHLDREVLNEALFEENSHIWEDFPEISAGDPPELSGAALTSVSLPETLKKIGAYAFYDCSSLSDITFYGTLYDLGAGLFTGCHRVSRLKLIQNGDGTSCLRELVQEIREKVTVTITGAEEARLVFPEFYEDSVENTPARILMTEVHGSGLSCRNSFYDRKPDYAAYDSCFYQTSVLHDFDTALETALARLCFPVKLSEKAEESYASWISAHLKGAFERAVRDENTDLLRLLTQEYALKGPGAEALIREASETAASAGFAEGTAYLMDVLNTQFHSVSAPRRFEF